MDINEIIDKIKSTISDGWNVAKDYLKSHIILSLIIQGILIIGLSIINYKIVRFGNFVGIYFISLGITFIDFLPIFGIFAPMSIWAVCAMTFGHNMKLGISLIILCFIAMLIQQIIEPFIVGKVMGITAIEEIISSIVGYFILGTSAIGFILGPIIYTVAKVIYLKRKNKPLIVEKKGYIMPSKDKENAKDITNDITNIDN